MVVKVMKSNLNTRKRKLQVDILTFFSKVLFCKASLAAQILKGKMELAPGGQNLVKNHYLN